MVELYSNKILLNPDLIGSEFKRGIATPLKSIDNSTTSEHPSGSTAR